MVQQVAHYDFATSGCDICHLKSVKLKQPLLVPFHVAVPDLHSESYSLGPISKHCGLENAGILDRRQD